MRQLQFSLIVGRKLNGEKLADQKVVFVPMPTAEKDTQKDTQSFGTGQKVSPRKARSQEFDDTKLGDNIQGESPGKSGQQDLLPNVRTPERNAGADRDAASEAPTGASKDDTELVPAAAEHAKDTSVQANLGPEELDEIWRKASIDTLTQSPGVERYHYWGKINFRSDLLNYSLDEVLTNLNDVFELTDEESIVRFNAQHEAFIDFATHTYTSISKTSGDLTSQCRIMVKE